MEGDEKKSIKYYELEYFLNTLIRINSQVKNKGAATSGDDIVDINDCGELLNSNSNGNNDSPSNGSGGTGNNSNNSGEFSNVVNSYRSLGSFRVKAWQGSGGSGPRAGVGEISYEFPVNALKENIKKGDDNDRVICPEGELIIVVNNVEEIINNLTGIAKCVFEILLKQNGNLFKKTIGQFIDTPKYNLTLEIGNCKKTNNACTDGGNVSTGEITIIIEDNFQKPLEMAATILHEGIHAEIFRYINEHENGLTDEDRPHLLNYYLLSKGLNNVDSQHQYMADKFVTPIAEAIRTLDNNKYSLDYYMSFGWDGLSRFAWDGYYDGQEWKKLKNDLEFPNYANKQQVILNSTTFNSDVCK